MLAGLSGLADRFSTFMREPMYNLGNSITDHIYTQAKRSESNLDHFITKVNNTFDPDVLEEVWLVLAKAFDSGNNEYIHEALKIADSLIKNCGARFHNSCTPLFMRRLKDMIITKAGVGGADNMKTMNAAKIIVRDWADAFMPVVSQGRGKVIVEGYQDMQRSGIHFPISTEKPKWVPQVNPVQKEKPRKESVHSEEETDFDIKAFYRQVKRLQEKLTEEGVEFFENAKAQSIADECEQSLPRIQKILSRAEAGYEDENFCSHVRVLISLCKDINRQYKEYKDSQGTPWSEEEDDWDWDSESKPSKSSKSKYGSEEREEPRQTQQNREVEDSTQFVMSDFDFFSF